MKRRLFNLLTLLSLLLCVAVTGLWVRTCWRHDVVQFPGRRYCLYTSPHVVWSATTDRPYWAGIPYQSYDDPPWGYHRNFGPVLRYTARTAPSGSSHAALGFVYHSYFQPLPRACRFTHVGVPLWAPFVLSALLPAWRLWRRRGRATLGTCAACGYDLRATPGRCPECGTVVTRPE